MQLNNLKSNIVVTKSSSSQVPITKRDEQDLSQLNICEEGQTLQDITAIKERILDAADVLATTQAEQGEVGIVECKIETGNHPPIKQPSRRVPFSVMGEMNKMVGGMLETGKSLQVHGLVR